MISTYKAIFTEEEISRIAEEIKNNGQREISVDLHELTVNQARKLVKNIIAIDREGCTLRVIHGYNRGTAIRSMVNNDLASPKIAERHICKNNPGQTILTISKAA